MAVLVAKCGLYSIYIYMSLSPTRVPDFHKIWSFCPLKSHFIRIYKKKTKTLWDKALAGCNPIQTTWLVIGDHHPSVCLKQRLVSPPTFNRIIIVCKAYGWFSRHPFPIHVLARNSSSSHATWLESMCEVAGINLRVAGICASCHSRKQSPKKNLGGEFSKSFHEFPCWFSILDWLDGLDSQPLMRKNL